MKKHAYYKRGYYWYTICNLNRKQHVIRPPYAQVTCKTCLRSFYARSIEGKAKLLETTQMRPMREDSKVEAGQE